MNPYQGGATRKKQIKVPQNRCANGTNKICVPINKKKEVMALLATGPQPQRKKAPEQFTEFNLVRDQVRKRYPDMPYKDVLALAGETYRELKGMPQKGAKKQSKSKVPVNESFDDNESYDFNDANDDSGEIIDLPDNGFDDLDELYEKIETNSFPQRALRNLPSRPLPPPNNYDYSDGMFDSEPIPSQRNQLRSNGSTMSDFSDHSVTDYGLDGISGEGFYGQQGRYAPNYYGTPPYRRPPQQYQQPTQQYYQYPQRELEQYGHQQQRVDYRRY